MQLNEELRSLNKAVIYIPHKLKVETRNQNSFSLISQITCNQWLWIYSSLCTDCTAEGCSVSEEYEDK